MSAIWIAVLICLWLAVAVLSVLVLGLLRRIAPILERAEAILATGTTPPGLPAGSPVPHFELSTRDGGTLAASDLLGHPFVLLFVSSSCGPCTQLAEAMRDADDPDLAVDLLVVADASGSDAELVGWGRRVTLAYQTGRRVSRAFETSATPHAFAVDSSGTVVAAGFPNDLEHLRALAAAAREGGDALTTSLMSRGTE